MDTATINLVPSIDYVATSITNSAAEADLLRHAVAASTLGMLRAIGFRLVLQVSTAAVLPPTLTLRLKFGGSTFVALSAVTLGAALTAKTIIIEGQITARASTASQTAWCKVEQGASGILGGLSQSIIADSVTGWTIDTTVAQTVSVTAQMGTANASNTITVISARLTLT